MSDLISELMEDRMLMKKTISDLNDLAHERAEAEVEYQKAKATTALMLKADGHSATMIQLLIKGDERVSEKLLERDCAAADHESAREALNVYKLDARLLEAQIDREYRG